MESLRQRVSRVEIPDVTHPGPAAEFRKFKNAGGSRSSVHANTMSSGTPFGSRKARHSSKAKTGGSSVDSAQSKTAAKERSYRESVAVLPPDQVPEDSLVWNCSPATQDEPWPGAGIANATLPSNSWGIALEPLCDWDCYPCPSNLPIAVLLHHCRPSSAAVFCHLPTHCKGY